MSIDNSSWLQRSEILLGGKALEKLAQSHVLLAGTGGVGAYAAEALVRSGIGKLTMYDPDKVHLTNLNRQLPALHSTLGEYKVKVLEKRLKDINPALELHALPEELTSENIPQIITENHFDYAIDAIDSVNEKCLLLAVLHQNNIPAVSSMGAGFRMDPTRIRYADISKTFNCKLAKTVRTILRKEYNINKGIMCVFSEEIPQQPQLDTPENLIGSNAFIPGIFGLFLAARAVDFLSKEVFLTEKNLSGT
jgi:tRNA A37 threonylcarbamoyladenosine dehydratase